MDPYVKLELDGKTFEVLRCLSVATQAFDESGNPASGVTAGKINLILQGTAEDSFNKWIGDPQKKMDGKITFSIDGSSFKKLEFKNAFMVRMHELYHDEGTRQVPFVDMPAFDEDKIEDVSLRDIEYYYRKSAFSLLMSCTISAEKISIDGVDHDNHW